jgi:hypothetical protein
MFRALYIKQWVQLSTLRWVGFGLCVVLPFFLWTGAAAAKRGWFPFTVGEYSLTTLFGEALPAFSILMWALLAVMFAAQTFAGDRADGTDRFLLERPVSRRSIWRARALAALFSGLWIVVLDTAYLYALVSITNDGTVADVFTQMLYVCGFGIGLTLLGTLGGMAAGEMVRTPMQGVMIGLVLAALPIGAAVFLSSVFEFVRFGDVLHLAYLVTPILPIVLLVASYRAGCLGEPSGRGRIKRGVTVLAFGLVLTPALFAAAAPFVLRAVVVGPWPQGIAAQADRAIIVGGGYRMNGGWMIDTAAAERTRFLPPPLRATGWNEAGTLAAVIHQSGVLGSAGPAKLELIDASGKTVNEMRIETDANSYVRGLRWAGDLVLVREWAGPRDARIKVVHPERGELGRIAVEEGKGRTWTLHGPTTDGTVYIHRLVSQEPRRYELAPLDLANFSIGEPVLTEDDDLPTFARGLLSPSGRYWARGVYAWVDNLYVSHVLDLHTGQRADYPASVVGGWLSGDRLVVLTVDEGRDEVRVVVQQGIEREILSRSFPRGVGVRISPDREHFLISQRSGDSGQGKMGAQGYFFYSFYWGLQGSRLDQLLVGDGTGWVELDSLRDGLQRDHVTLNWGGPNTVIATGETATAVAAAEPGASWTGIVGDWD